MGYKVDEFPAFYSRNSGCFGLDVVKSSSLIVKIQNARLSAGLRTALLIANPVPEKDEIPSHKINKIIKTSYLTAKRKVVKGKELTPFLLREIVKETKGKSLEANISLAINNVELGAKIAYKKTK